MTNDQYAVPFGGRALNRRATLAAMAGVGLVPILQTVAPRTGLASEPADLSVFTWAGYEVPELFGPYVDKHGVTPSFAFFSSQEEALQKIRAGYATDTMHPCLTKVQKFHDAGLIKPIDTNRIDAWDDIWPQLRDLEGVRLADGNVYMVPIDWGNTSYCYRTDVFGEDAEESWTALWDPANKGRIAMQDGIDNIAAASLALGMDPYDLDEAGLEMVRDHLIEQRELVRFYWESTTEYVNAMAAGEVDLAVCWNDGPVNLQNQGVPVKLANPKEGILAWVCGIVHIASGSADDDLVYDYINAFLAPESGAFEIDAYGFGHSNSKAFDLVPAERLAELGISDVANMMETAVFQRTTPLRDRWDIVWEEIKLGL